MAKMKEYTAEAVFTVRAKILVNGHDDDEAYDRATEEAFKIQESITDLGLNIKADDAPDVYLVDWEYAEDEYDDSDFYREEAARDYNLLRTA